MNKYIPPFEISNKMLDYISSIMEKIGKLSNFSNLDKMPILRRNNRIKSIHSSLAIEANSLSLNEVKDVTCKTCGLSFDDVVNSGRLGCPDCYETFESRLDPILKRMQGANRHTGRLGEISEKQVEFKKEKPKKEEVKESKLENLEKQLKEAIKEERYEDAAKLRDEIKKQQKGEDC